MSPDNTHPHDLAAEISVLGAMFIDRDAAEAAMAELKAEDFYREGHRRIFAAMQALHESGDVVDLVTLAAALKVAGDLKAAGGNAYIAKLLDAVPSSANAAYHMRIVREKAHLRRLIGAAMRVQVLAAAEDAAPDAVQDGAESLVYGCATDQASEDVEHVRVAMMSALEQLERNEPDTLSGLADLDHLTMGFPKGDLVLLGARPSMGKTALSMQIAANVAHQYQRPVALFSLEMTRQALARRLLFTEARVDHLRYRRGVATDADYSQLARAAEVINKLPLYLEDAARTVRAMRAKCRRLASKEGPLAMILVDYVQLMHGEGDNRNLEVASVSAGLKRLAVEFDCPAFVLAQLARRVEDRPDKRPMMSDLRDSGALEQDADTIMFLYRPEYYFGPTIKTGKGNDGKVQNVEGLAELIVAKQRNGATGVVNLSFRKEFTRFDSYSPRTELRAV